MKTIDTVFDYRGYGPQPAFCRLEIYTTSNGCVVVMYETNSNTGTSIINAAEEVASLVAKEYELSDGQTRWIQYVEVMGEPLIQEVTFDLTRTPNGPLCFDPEWHQLSEVELRRLVGEDWVPAIA